MTQRVVGYYIIALLKITECHVMAAAAAAAVAAVLPRDGCTVL